MRKFLWICILALGITITISFYFSNLSPFHIKTSDRQKRIQVSPQTASGENVGALPYGYPPGKTSMALINFEADLRLKEILARSSPDARDMFDKALEVLLNGDPLEALGKFREITWKYRDDSVRPLAEWAVGLSYYRTGGPGYALFAADRFDQYCEKFSGSAELDFLVKAAASNRAFIEKQLREFDPAELLTPKWELKSEGQKQNYTRFDEITLAQKYIEAFLSEHPRGPLQNTAKEVLAKIQEFSKRK